MNLELCNFEKKTKKAIKLFWQRRLKAVANQKEKGVSDQGERSGVTAGNNLDGFVELLSSIVKKNGSKEFETHIRKKLLTLPGYFRPTKSWDFIVIKGNENERQLVATIELKSHIGPSFGNNFNNRAEEALGSSLDFQTAYREGAFGEYPKPFLGWIMVVEDCDKSNSPIVDREPHFSIFEDFKNASYIKRYEILCKKMIQENLYSSTALIKTSRTAIKNGNFSSTSKMIGIEAFVKSFAAHIAMNS